MRTTLLFEEEPLYIGRANLGEMLNQLAELGWTVDQSLVGARRAVLGICVPVTRHKFHIILKKEYNENEDPFEGLEALKKQKTTPAVK